jgi:hypothetical protein
MNLFKAIGQMPQHKKRFHKSKFTNVHYVAQQNKNE